MSTTPKQAGMLSIYVPIENIPEVTVEVSSRSSLRLSRVLTQIRRTLRAYQ